MNPKREKIALELKNLTKNYGKQRGIENINLSVKSGEIFGFLGPNGAGKSTAIRTILNFQSPSSGTASIFGLDSVKSSVEAKKRVSYLAGELAVYDDLTGRQFLEYLGSFDAKFDWGEVESLAKRFQAELDRKLRTLSKGNRQKIGIIQAFMHKPDLLILDEPTSGLDPLMQEEFFKLLKETKARGASVFFSSHNIGEVQRVADRAGFIRDGQLVSVEDVSSLRDINLHRLQVTFGKSRPTQSEISKVKNVSESNIAGANGLFVIKGSVDSFIKAIAKYDVVSIDREETSLEDIFLKFYEGSDEDK